MNRICIAIVLTLACVTFNICKSQTNFKTILEISFGTRSNQLQSAPSDIFIDRKGFTYIPDDLNSRILVFEETTYVRTIKVPVDMPAKRDSAYKMYLAIDEHDRLYVHTTYHYRTVALYRFERDGNSLFKFPFTTTKPGGGDIASRIFVSKSGHLYIPTGPAEILRANWENSIYKYDTDGNFVALVDYYIEDQQGNIYKPSMSKIGTEYHWQLNKFKGPSDPTATSKSLEKVQTLSVPTGITDAKRNELSYAFCGFDSSMNTYVSNGVITKVFNQSFGFLREIPTSIEDVKKVAGLLTLENRIRISEGGNVIIFGIRQSDNKFLVLEFK